MHEDLQVIKPSGIGSFLASESCSIFKIVIFQQFKIILVVLHLPHVFCHMGQVRYFTWGKCNTGIALTPSENIFIFFSLDIKKDLLLQNN